MELTVLGRVYIFKYLRSKWLALFGVLLLSFSVFASNGKTTYQAKIVKPDGYPLEAANVTFKFTVLDTVGACVLYSELYSAVDMRSTGGLISFALGNGVRDFPASGTTAVFAKVFDNSITSMPCQAPGIYNPGPNDTRKIVMQFNDGTGWQTLPAMTINSVPYAMYADQASNAKALNGKADSDFVEVSTLAGLNCGVNQAIKFNNATFSCIDVPASGSGGISSVTTSGSVLVTGGTASAPVISIQAATLSQDGYLTSLDYAEFKAKLSASATQIINTLGFTPVSSSTVASQIASSTLAGDVSGTPGNNIVSSVGGKTAAQVSASVDDTSAATASATAGTLVKRDISGNATLNDLYASAAKINYVDIYKPTTSFNVRLQAPTSLNASYVLNLPTTSGTAGQVLSTDGAGNLSWINPSTGSVVSVSATAPLASTGGTTPTISISQATSGTDGYLSSADWNTFNNKQQATSAAIMATLGYEPVASGSVVSSQWVSNGTSISYEQGFVGIGLSDPAHNLSVSGTAFFSGVATVSGSLNGAVVLPGGNVNQNPVIFRFDQNVLAYADKWATVTTTPVFNAQKLFNINDGGVNLYDVNAGADVVIEVTGVSIGNTSHNNMWPFVAFHSNPTGNVKLEVMSSSLAWETAYEGPTAAYVLKKFSMSAGGLRGARFTFSAMSPGTWLKTVGVIGRNSTPYQWVLRRDGGTVYGDINLLAKLGVGISSPSARLQIASGSTSIAPLKINSGTLLSSAQAGAIEYDGVNFYLTDDTNTRRSIATVASPGSFDNANTISNSAGNITLSPNNTTGSVVVSATTASTNANTGALVVKGGVGVSGNLNVSGTMATSNIVTSIINGTTDLLLNPSGGNVGVGVSSPTSRLDVGGDINMANNSVLRSGGRQLLIMGLSGTTYLDSNGPGSGIRLQPNGNVAMTLTASGNVGIGTTVPGKRFDVDNMTANFDGLRLRGTQDNVQLTLSNAGTGGRQYDLVSTGGAAGAGQGKFSIYDAASAAHRLAIDSSGNVGVGVVSPNFKLHVNSDSDAGFRISRSSLSGSIKSGIANNIGDAFNSTDVDDSFIYNDSGAFAIGTIASHSVKIGTNGQERMRVDSSGKVGIGTTTPSSKLQVDGNLTLREPVDGRQLQLLPALSGGPSFIRNNFTTAGFQFQNNPSGDGLTFVDLVRIDTIGNLGIGVSNPTSKLQVSGDIKMGGNDKRGFNISQDYMSLGETDSGATTILGNNIKVTNGSDNTVQVSANSIDGSKWLSINYIRGFTFHNVASSPIGTQMNESTGELMRLTPNGNLGIGTATPGAPLEVVRNTAFGGVANFIKAFTPANNEAPYLSFMHQTVAGGSFSRYGFIQSGAGVNGINIQGLNGSESGANIILNAQYGGGNVGIGTTNPGAKLDIAGATYFANQKGYANYYNFSPYDQMEYGAIGTTTSLALVTNSVSRLFITPSGNVGIGTHAPSEKLHVVGNVRVQGSTDCILGNGAGGTNCSSDIRLKENVKPISYALEKIKSMQGIEFDWNKNSVAFGRHDIGVIAQDVEKVFPSAVVTDSSSGYKKVDYAVLVAPLIQAIKEFYSLVMERFEKQDRQLASITISKVDKSEIEKLKADNAAKAKEIKALKAYLCAKDPAAAICK